MYNEFNEIYQNVYKENNKVIEEIRKKTLLRYIGISSMFILAVVFIILGFFEISVSTFFATIILLVCYTKDNEYNKVYKEKVIKKFIEEYDENLNFYPNKGISMYDYRKGQFEIFNKFYSEDYIAGIVDGIKIQMAEVKTEYITIDREGNKSSIVQFHGIFGKVDLTTTFPGILKIRANKNFLEKITDYSLEKMKHCIQEKKLEMDSPEFEKHFDIYTDNQIKAMQVLTPDIMSKMIDFHEKSKIAYELNICENSLCVRFKCGKAFEANVLESALDMQTLKRNYNIINFIFDIAKTIAETINEKEF